jgi:hypothetical protein
VRSARHVGNGDTTYQTIQTIDKGISRIFSFPWIPGKGWIWMDGMHEWIGEILRFEDVGMG